MTAAIPMLGNTEAQQRFLKARESGRLHHGWIINGPSGIGKSIMAERLAALMLGASSVDAAADDAVMQKVISGSHPDLKWVKRELNDKGKLRQDITVDQVRSLNQFFALKPALAGWRVGVLDALDDANVSGLNALLKTLEEPPQNAILFLISHGTKPVLPTIRSRCQLLRLNRLSDDDTKAVFKQLDINDKMAISLSNGRPGYGLSLKDSGGGKAVQSARALLKSIHRPTPELVAEALGAAAVDDGALAAFTDALLEWTADQAGEKPPLGKVWLALHKVRAEAIELNMTPLQTASKLLTVLQDGLKALAVQA